MAYRPSVPVAVPLSPGKTRGEHRFRRWKTVTAFLDFTVSSGEFPLGEALDVDAASHVELAQFVPVRGEFVPYVWAETEDDDAVASDVAASAHVADVDKLAGATGRTLFRVRWCESVDGLFENLRRHDLTVLRAVGDGETWNFKLVAENRERFQAFQLACQEEGIQLTVTRLSNSTAHDNALYGLTVKQREALLHAYESGYYDSETPVDLTALSEDLGISQQAFGARLKRGTGALIRNTIAIGCCL